MKRIRKGDRETKRRTKTARPKQGCIEHVGTVGAGEHEDARRRIKAVHLNEDLIERILPLVVAAHQSVLTLTTGSSDGVNLVDKDDARLVLPRLRKEVADARWADAHDHLDEF